MGIRSTLDMLPNLPFNRVGLLDVSSGTPNAVAGSPERPDIKNPLGVSQHPPLPATHVSPAQISPHMNVLRLVRLPRCQRGFKGGLANSDAAAGELGTVSYTHLTLPTIYSV